MKRFTVVVAFTGECCSFPHLLHQRTLAESRGEARQKILRQVTREGNDASEAIVLDGWPGSSPVREVLPSERVSGD